MLALDSPLNITYKQLSVNNDYFSLAYINLIFYLCVNARLYTNLISFSQFLMSLLQTLTLVSTQGIEYAGCISTERARPPSNKCPGYDTVFDSEAHIEEIINGYVDIKLKHATQKLMLDSCKMIQKQSEAFHTFL